MEKEDRKGLVQIKGENKGGSVLKSWGCVPQIMGGFRFLGPLVRPGWKTIKRTFIAGKRDVLARNEEEIRIYYIIQRRWGGGPAVWRASGCLPSRVSRWVGSHLSRWDTAV